MKTISIKRIKAQREGQKLARKINVLIVDDEKVNLLAMRFIARKIDQCEVDYAENGLDALDKLSKEEFDLIFMDCQMPVMDGKETIKKIRCSRDRYSDIPIICISSKHSSPTKVDCSTCKTHCEIDGVMGKPFVRKIICDIIESRRKKVSI